MEKNCVRRYERAIHEERTEECLGCIKMKEHIEKALYLTAKKMRERKENRKELHGKIRERNT